MQQYGLSYIMLALFTSDGGQIMQSRVVAAVEGHHTGFFGSLVHGPACAPPGTPNQLLRASSYKTSQAGNADLGFGGWGHAQGWARSRSPSTRVSLDVEGAIPGFLF